MALLMTMENDIDCETCGGIGHSDETLGGYADINDSKVTCPDCAGTGKYEDSITCGEKQDEQSTASRG